MTFKYVKFISPRKKRKVLFWGLFVLKEYVKLIENNIHGQKSKEKCYEEYKSYNV